MAVALGKQHLAKGISFILVILKCEMRCLIFDRDWRFPRLFESPCFLRRGDTSDPWLGLLTSGRDLGSAGPHMCLFFPPSPLAWPGAILRAWCRADGKGPAGCAVCSAESCSSPELCSWALLVNLSFFPACSFQRKTLGFFSCLLENCILFFWYFIIGIMPCSLIVLLLRYFSVIAILSNFIFF